jgi:hypothetical protein
MVFAYYRGGGFEMSEFKVGDLQDEIIEGAGGPIPIPTPTELLDALDVALAQYGVNQGETWPEGIRLSSSQQVT